MDHRFEFIYCPKAGSRVFANRGDTIRVGWGNGSEHVLCVGVVRVYAAAAGGWWRTRARELASRLVKLLGGSAADEQGEIGYFAPTEAAYVAACVVFAHAASLEIRDANPEARLFLNDTRDELLLRAWEHGVGIFDSTGPDRVESRSALSSLTMHLLSAANKSAKQEALPSVVRYDASNGEVTHVPTNATCRYKGEAPREVEAATFEQVEAPEEEAPEDNWW